MPRKKRALGAAGTPCCGCAQLLRRRRARARAIRADQLRPKDGTFVEGGGAQFSTSKLGACTRCRATAHGRVTPRLLPRRPLDEDSSSSSFESATVRENPIGGATPASDGSVQASKAKKAKSAKNELVDRAPAFLMANGASTAPRVGGAAGTEWPAAASRGAERGSAHRGR